VTLDERVALEFAKTPAVFVGLVAPHAAHCLAAEVPEALDLLCMLLELIVQRCRTRSALYVRKRTIALGSN
jgi:hypothetical protein